MATTEDLWASYAAAAVAAGHRREIVIGEIADEAVAAHRARFPASPAGNSPATGDDRKPSKGRDDK